MSPIRQVLLGLALTAAVVAGWIAFVPSAGAYLERWGLLDLLGMEPAEAAQEPEGRGFGGGGPQDVVIAEVSRRVLDDRVEAIGDGEALRSVTLRSEATGTVEAIEVEAGGRVEAGAVVARLDDEAERLALERARLVLADAEAEVDRATRLARRGAVASVETEEAELALRTARLGAREAELALARRTIRAPFAGWIGLIEVEEGDRIAAQDPIAVLADRSEIVVEFRVPERAIADLRLGMAFEATPLALPGRTLTGEVTAIDNVVDRSSRTLAVEGRLPNEDDLLRGGMAFAVEMAIPGEALPAVDPLAVQWSSEGSLRLDGARGPGGAGARHHPAARRRRGARGGGVCRRAIGWWWRACSPCGRAPRWRRCRPGRPRDERGRAHAAAMGGRGRPLGRGALRAPPDPGLRAERADRDRGARGSARRRDPRAART